MEKATDVNREDDSVWKRVLFMLLFVVIYSVAELVVFAVTVIQVGFVLITGERNGQLLAFGNCLSKYVYQVLKFFLFETETKPFPFSEWPQHGSDIF